jgi:hypothetical protein
VHTTTRKLYEVLRGFVFKILPLFLERKIKELCKSEDGSSEIWRRGVS